MSGRPTRSRRRHGPPIVLAVAVASTAACSAAGDPAVRPPDASSEPAASVEIAPGAVVEPAAGRVYLMLPGGGLEAVAAATGEPLWSSREAARPLAAARGLLLAQVEPGPAPGALRLALLDVADGRLLPPVIEAPLPPEVPPRIDDTAEITFSLGAGWRGERFVVSWSFLQRWATGVSPPAGEPPFRHRDDGRFAVDPVGRSVAPLADGDEPQPALPEALARRLAAGEIARRPWPAGDLFASVEMRVGESGRRRALLSRWRAVDGEPLPAVELPPEGAVSALPSADGRHVLVVDAPPAADRAVAYRWSVFSVAGADRVAELPSETSAQPFCLVGERLLHLAQPRGRRVAAKWLEEPRRLRAIGLDGTQIWVRPLRDPAYRGPRPPAGS